MSFEQGGRRRRGRARPRQGRVRLVALDMDGTLLDSASRVLPSSVDALRAALARGVAVCLATGKARPAAMAAMRTVGLEGARPPAQRGQLSRMWTIWSAGALLIYIDRKGRLKLHVACGDRR